MTPEQWGAIETLFLKAIELPEGDRQKFLEIECEGDAELLAELRRMLRNDCGATGNDRDVARVVGQAAASVSGQTNAWVGRRLGPYRIVDAIGHGGMGAVFRAVRDDDQFHIEVAIKTLKFEASDAAALSRFRQERQLLASLEHPNIARLLDGGTTESGTPYIVMEYVPGAPIDRYQREKNPSLRDRLQLAILVCEAVQYAHQRLVVHRDIKPGNILVTADGVPKLVDFGIAKLLDPAGSDSAAAPTWTGLAMMTPEYASPEQVRGEAVSTATDVYSLGVLLYELLSGERPHRWKGRDAAEMARAVCDEPVKPPSAAGNRKLRGDLDTIVLKAMHKEPARRYGSAGQLAEDLRRHLDGRPVLARPDAVIYRFRKYARRHWAVLASAAAVLAASSAGAVISTYEARRAERNSQDVRHLANHFVFDVYDELLKVPGNVKARQMILSLATEYLDRAARDAGGNASLLQDLAAAYERLGNVYGTYDDTSNLGHVAEAVGFYRKAVEIDRRLGSSDPQSLLRIGRLYMQIGRTASFSDPAYLAEAAGQVRAIGDRLLAMEPHNAEFLELAGQGCMMQSDLESEADPVHANELIAEAVRHLDAAHRSLRSAESALALFDATLRRARRLQFLADFDAALQAVDQAEALAAEAAGSKVNLAAINAGQAERYRSRIYLSLDWPSMGDAQAARMAVEKAAAPVRAALQADPRDFDLRVDLAYSERQRIAALLEIDPRQAVSASRSNLELLDSITRDSPADPFRRRERLIALRLLTEALVRANKTGEALRLTPDLLEQHERLVCHDVECEPGLDLALARLTAAQAYGAAGQYAKAEELFAASAALAAPLRNVRPARFRNGIAVSKIYLGMGDYYAGQGKREVARDWYAKAAQLWAEWTPASQFTKRMSREAQARLEGLTPPGKSL